MTLWEERAGRNEALFREVNERVLDLASDIGQLAGNTQFVCECSRDDCTEQITVPLTVYEAVRADPRRFLILRGHENVQIETVVERTDGYLIIEKEGPAARIADRTDPRV
jgi:hypothetical protein